jgi:hypothetical protein
MRSVSCARFQGGANGPGARKAVRVPANADRPRARQSGRSLATRPTTDFRMSGSSSLAPFLLPLQNSKACTSRRPLNRPRNLLLNRYGRAEACPFGTVMLFRRPACRCPVRLLRTLFPASGTTHSFGSGNVGQAGCERDRSVSLAHP